MIRIICCGLAIYAASLLAETEPALADATYNVPEMNGVPIDGCASWQADCGKPAADQFCRTQGFAESRTSTWAYDLRTWNMGSQRYCDLHTDKINCGGLRVVVCTGGAAPGSPDYRAALVAKPWIWIDNGGAIGTITFAADGSAKDTWLNLTEKWRVDTNGDLLVFASGMRWVTRLHYDPATNTFSGARDRSSQTQDGITTQLRVQ